EDEIVRVLEILNPRHPRVMLNVARIGDVQQLLTVGADEIANVAFNILRPDLSSSYPFRSVVRDILLIKRLAMNAVRKTLKDQRPIHEVRNQVRRNPVVIVDQVTFGIAVFRPENLVKIGEFNGMSERFREGTFLRSRAP